LPEEELPEEELQMKPMIQLEELLDEELPEEELQMKPVIQREGLLEEEEELQMKAYSSGQGSVATGALEERLGRSKGGGSALSEDVRSFMEPRFGADFGGVRVHTGSEAVQMNREVGAQAFAHGQDVYFGAGKEPGKDALTAHELTHVVQQNNDLTKAVSLQKSPAEAKNTGLSSGNKNDWAKKIRTQWGYLFPNSGQLTATRKEESVIIQSAGVNYDGKVSLVTGVKLGSESIKAGIIQTLNSSERIGVYTRKDKEGNTEVVSERRSSLGLCPDAITKDENGKPIPVYPPFYVRPITLSDQNSTAEIITSDRPSASFPATIGTGDNKGTLTSTRGADCFSSSLAIQHENEEPIHLEKKFKWSQNWSMLIVDESQLELGPSVESEKTEEAPAVPGGDVANVKGNNDNYINAYTNQEAANSALKAAPAEFLQSLSRHKVKAPDSYELMLKALSSSSIKVKVTVEDNDKSTGKDKITVIASFSASKDKSLYLNKRQSGEIDFSAKEVFEPRYLDEKSIISLWINGKSTEWKFPFSYGSCNIFSGDGRYKAEYHLN
jgi:hypothetical protein